MANSYEKKDYRLYNTQGVMLSSQPEGVQEGALTRLHNTKIYREGAIGLRDQRDFFAGTVRREGLPGWVTGITRLDNDWILAFVGRGLYGWRRAVPGPALDLTDVAFPRGEVSVAFEDFLPLSGVATHVSVLPDERANPAIYFSKPETTRMWKVYTVRPTADGGVTRRTRTGSGATTTGLSASDSAAFSAGSGFTDQGVIAAPSVYPIEIAYWGINSPTGRPAGEAQNISGGGLASKGTVDGQKLTGTIPYDYVWTHLNSSTGSESNPSAGLEAQIQVQRPTHNSIRLEMPVDTGGDPQIDRIRVYRRGGTLTDYHRHSEISLRRGRGEPITGAFLPQTVVLEDVKKDADIAANPILRLDNFVPFISTNSAGDAVWNAVCAFVFGPFNPGNVILGIGEANKPGSVFWTNVGRPDSSNGPNNVDVTSSGDPLVSGVVHNGIPFVASRADWYALDPQRGNDLTEIFFIPRKTAVGKGPIAPWAVAAGDYICFVNTEGIFATDGQTAAIDISTALTPIFHGEACGEYKPIKWDAPQSMFRLFWSAPELHFIYCDTDEQMQHLIYDGKKWRSEEFARGQYALGDTPTQPGSGSEPWTVSAPAMHTTCVYNDTAWPERSLLLGSDRGALFIVRPYVSTGWEMSDYGVVDPAQLQNPEAASYYGWVLGHFRTGTDDFGAPAQLKELGNVSFEASGKWSSAALAGKAKLTLYATAESAQEEVGTSSRLETDVPIGSTIVNADKLGRARYVFPIEGEEVYSSAWDFRFFGRWEFHNLTLFHYIQTEVVKFWQNADVNHGIDGWQHVRDGYMDLTLYGPATLTLEVDGEEGKTQSVTISPLVTRGDGTVDDMTGRRFKYYVSFLPMKGKKFTWKLSCSAGMQVWHEGSEIKGKPWITSTGYRNVNPLAPGSV